MASSNTRQRKLARAKIERQSARRAELEQKQRRTRAGIGAGVAVLVVLGGLWLGGVFDKEPPPAEAAKDCTWNQQDVSANPSLKSVELPPATGIAKDGTANLSIALNSGTVAVTLDHRIAPCGTASLKHLADAGFYNGSNCHKLNHADGFFALACGDPSGTGNGGANYTWFAENVPPAAEPSPSPAPADGATVRYPKGTVAMMPNLNGSQFLIFYQDSSTADNYSVVGHIDTGLDVVEKIAAAGTVSDTDPKPKNDVTIQALTVADVVAATPTPTSAPSAEPSATPSTAPSAKA